MYDTLLFDCDGVIVDSEKGLAVIAATTLRESFGIPADAGDFIDFIGTGEDGYIGGVVRKHGGVYSHDMKDEIYRQYLLKAKNVVRAFEGTREVLRRFREEGFRIAVASSSDIVKVKINLEIAGLTNDDFDAVITGSDVTNKKPDPEIYLKAMEKCSSAPCNCIVIEDAISGITAGIRAGAAVIAYTSSLKCHQLKKAGAFAFVRGPYELYEVVHETRKSASS